MMAIFYLASLSTITFFVMYVGLNLKVDNSNLDIAMNINLLNLLLIGFCSLKIKNINFNGPWTKTMARIQSDMNTLKILGSFSLIILWFLLFESFGLDYSEQSNFIRLIILSVSGTLFVNTGIISLDVLIPKGEIQ